MGAGVLLIGVGAYEFIASTESSEFCGQVCHTPMYPEYTTYRASPHSTVECSSCHVGEGSYHIVSSKMRGIPQIFETLLGTYERPISSPVDNLRPARETCEECHTPEKFSGNLVRTRTTFKEDAENTKEINTVVLKVGGGTSEVSEGIHWHILSQVWYLPLDEERLNIGWVGVEKDGVINEYIDPDQIDLITPERIETEKRLMDCVDCHNRATHIFQSPDELVDKALEDGSIDDSIPYIKREALEALGVPAPSLKLAYARVDAVRDYYRDNYPEFYSHNLANIERAVGVLRKIATLTTFPEMMVDWNTHADHSGHNKPPDSLMAGSEVNFDNWSTNKSEGCFRCHGKLVATDSTASTVNIQTPVEKVGEIAASSKYVDASCNLCHYTASSGAKSPLPKSVLHPTEGLEDCLLCHGESALKPYPEDHPWSTNETCITCHAVSPLTSLPTFRQTTDLSEDIPHPTKGLENCLLCHGESAVESFGNNHPWSTNETCSACHAKASNDIPISPDRERIPTIPHSTEGLTECRLCHDETGVQPYPSNHSRIPGTFCTLCHKPT